MKHDPISIPAERDPDLQAEIDQVLGDVRIGLALGAVFSVAIAAYKFWPMLAGFFG